MDLNEVAIFVKVIQKGSFTAAAQDLDMPKSTVSAKISSLENRLGTSLITRSTRKLSLTAAGEAFYLRSTKALDELFFAESAVRSESLGPQGRFRVTAPVDVGNTILPILAAQFLKQYPQVDLEIILSDQNVDFLGDQIDLAIRAGSLKDSSLIAKRVGKVGFRLYASPTYLKANKTPRTLKDLQDHMGILFTPLWKDGWVLRGDKKSQKIRPGKIITSNNMTMTHGLALEGAGISYLPSFLCEADVKAGRLVHVLKEFRSEVAPLHFVYPAQKYVPPAVKAFMDMSIEKLNSRFSFKG